VAKLNLLKTDEACTDCIKCYAKRHRLKTGGQFKISCSGIPKSYSNEEQNSVIPVFSAELLMDPVKWAAEVLDWHCLDPDSEVWKRKDIGEYVRQNELTPGRQSKFHRPYQATMLRCTAKRKVFRIGRQAGKTESLVISVLFNLFTNSDFKVVLITPFQSQIDLIFKRLEELIRNTQSLQSAIKRNVKAPQYSIELHNGSYIKGFTAGTKSGSGAASARGQAANMLIFDEADYLATADLDAAMSIITNYPEATVWMSSTPTGKRDKFYEICGDDEWKEFHLPSYINPNWSEALDKFYRKSLTAIGYKHEVLADFGEQEEGVFQVQYVEAAQAEYEYGKLSPNPGWLYSIGVDWNSPAVGTTIVVTGFNPSNSKFYVVEREVVQRAGWTQLAACEAITKMNRRWRPFVIYVDKGFGSTQLEVLHKFGYDSIRDKDKGPNHIDSKLPKIVKAYDFGSKIEVRDPFTKQLTSKPAKGFLVENSVRRFETGDLFYPVSDTQITKELLAYIVKNVSISGQFIYASNSESVGDHNIDALMLSLIGFTLEKTAFGTAATPEKIEFTNIGEKTEQFYEDSSNKLVRKDLIKQQSPQKGRDDIDTERNIPSTGIGRTSKDRLPLWTEGPEKRKETPYIPGRNNSENRRGMGFGGRVSGGPPRRRNID
jgi:replicative DNA helicase